MQGRCLDIASLSRYLHRLAELEDVLHVEGHVGHCVRCRDKLQRMKRYTETLFDDHDPAAVCDSDCPSLIALEHFRRDALQERQMIRIQSHLRNCFACREWVRQREPVTAPWEVPVLLLPATRAPDLDLRVARQGVRVAAGAEALDLDAFPSLLQRLDLKDPGQGRPVVTVHRTVRFRLTRNDAALRGRIDFLGYEGFRLTLGWPRRGAPTPLFLWTRSQIREHWDLGSGGGEVASLLTPGHYFVGSDPDEEPLLALSVEPELLSPQALAACGYAACRAGRFASALSCFEQAWRLVPSQQAYEALYHRTRALARRFGVADRDLDIAWETPALATPLPEPPSAVALGHGEDDVGEILALVESLRRQVVSPGVGAPRPVARVSRRRFRPAYASLMRHVWASLEELSISVESPISCR